jgi:thiol-disulfide isomerase/thioredoxin
VAAGSILPRRVRLAAVGTTSHNAAMKPAVAAPAVPADGLPVACPRKPKLALERRRCLTGLAGAAAAAALPGVWAQSPPAGEEKTGAAPRIGTVIPLPEVPMLDGSTFRPAQARGQVLVIYWWASWCPFCAVQSPLMDKLWREASPRGLKMLALSIDKKPEDAIAYRTKRGLTFPSGFVTPEVARVLPKPKGLPVTYVRGRDDKLLMVETGQMFPEDVEAIAAFL